MKIANLAILSVLLHTFSDLQSADLIKRHCAVKTHPSFSFGPQSSTADPSNPDPHPTTAGMHQAAVRAFRTTYEYLNTIRSLRTITRASRRGFQSTSHTQQLAHRRQHPRPDEPSLAALRSSMYFRRVPVALVSSVVVGYGAWYSYNAGYSTASSSVAHSLTSTRTDALPTRTVLVVGADELRQGTIVGDVPITKQTADGRKIVEMLTHDQSTQKLRRSEQSFSVHRGQGVTRYDLVQLPSNDPIEDDHAEKIVEVPARGAADVGNVGSDWMFWGVFDGHS